MFLEIQQLITCSAILICRGKVYGKVNLPQLNDFAE